MIRLIWKYWPHINNQWIVEIVKTEIWIKSKESLHNGSGLSVISLSTQFSLDSITDETELPLVLFVEIILTFFLLARFIKSSASNAEFETLILYSL